MDDNNNDNDYENDIINGYLLIKQLFPVPPLPALNIFSLVGANRVIIMLTMLLIVEVV